MNSPVVGVLALQGDVGAHIAALTGAGVRAVAVRRPTELDGIDGLVIPGGESTTMARIAAAFDLLDPLRTAVRAGLPVYGSCAGMIMLADRIIGGTEGQETIGGLDVAVRRNAFGRQVDSFEAEVGWAGFDTPFHAVFIRAPWVESVGAGVEVLARVGDRAAGTATGTATSRIVPAGDGPAEGTVTGAAAGRIVAVRQGSLLATSFHPELTGDTRVHRLFAGIVKGKRGTQ